MIEPEFLEKIAAQLDVYEFLNILDFTMQDLVYALKEQVEEHEQDFKEQLDN